MESKNELYFGDNLDVLRKHIKDKSIDLCYIDPPFNSKRTYNQIYNNFGQDDRAQAQAFTDTWEWDSRAIEGLNQILDNEQGRFTSQTIELIKGFRNVLREGSLLAYLVSMTLRITEIHRGLKPTGSFYLHCDPTASHYLKIVCDTIFCTQGGDFKSEIVWRRTGSHNKMQRYAPIHDIIFFYTKSGRYTWNNPKRPYMRGHVEEHFVKDENGYRTNYYGNVLTGSGIRGGESGKPWRGINPTERNRHWAIPGAVLEEIGEDLGELTQHQKLERLVELGYIRFDPNQTWPVYERYLKPTDGQALSDIWAFQPYTGGTVFNTQEGIDEDVRWLSTKDRERLGYPTQKPEGLLQRIIEASSNEGDVILDAYCGCGTTIAVAQKLNRRWVGIDITYQSISLVLKRLEDSFGPKTLKAITLDGIPSDMASATALAHKKDDRLRKEFEKWAILTYSNNRAMINEKKGADRGVDGVAYFMASKTENQKMIFQVKSGHVSERDIRDFMGTIELEKAQIGTFITLQKPTSRMTQVARAAGVYHHALMERDYNKIQIVPVKDIVEKGARLEMPLIRDVLKPAKPQPKGVQLEFRAKKEVQLELQPKAVQLELGQARIK